MVNALMRCYIFVAMLAFVVNAIADAPAHSDTGIGKWFCNEDQRFAITTDGTTSVWKFGKRCERLLNSNIVTITDEVMP